MNVVPWQGYAGELPLPPFPPYHCHCLWKLGNGGVLAENSHEQLAGYARHVIPHGKVSEAAQCHLVVITNQHHTVGQLHPVVCDVVLVYRSWLALLGNMKTTQWVASVWVAILEHYESLSPPWHQQRFKGHWAHYLSGVLWSGNASRHSLRTRICNRKDSWSHC